MLWLRTTHVVSPAGFGMGYRPASARNRWKNRNRPPFWTVAHLFGRASTNDNPQGTTQFCGKVLNQGQVGSCTAESSCKASRITLAGRGQMPPGVEDFSQWLFYGGTRQIERAASVTTGALPPLSDSGCEADDCITCASEIGVAPMLTPVPGYYNDVDPSNVNTEPVLGDYERTTLEPGAYDVDTTSSDVPAQWQTMVTNDLGGTLALFVDTQNFMAYNGSAPIQTIDQRDPQGGGHQICGPVGWYTSSALGLVWVFLNSWGETWGKAGFGEITHKCLMTSLERSIVWNSRLLTKAA